MRLRPRHRRDPRRVGIPPVTTRWAAVRLGVSLLHVRRVFEERIASGTQRAVLRRAADRWSYADPVLQRAWTYFVDGVLHEAERRTTKGQT